MNRSLYVVLFLLPLAPAAGGCGRASAPVSTAAAVPSTPPRLSPVRVEGEGWPRRVFDSVGREVEIPAAPKRVVSLAPSNTEILFAVGAGDLVVGVTMMDDYPPEVKSRTSVGGMAIGSMNLETLAALKPDLVLATAGVQQPAVEPLQRLGLTVVAFDAEKPSDVAGNIRAIGRIVDHVTQAERLAADFEARVDAVRLRVAARPGPRPKVLYLLYDDPLMTVGPTTFLGRMVEEAGGVNVFGDVSSNYPTPSDEQVLVRAPEVILATFGLMSGGGRSEAENQKRLMNRPGWGDVPAVRDRRIYALDEDLTTRIGPRLVDGLEAIEKALEPPKS